MPNEPTPQPSAFDLLAQFTKLRQEGMSRDDAWYKVVDAVPHLNDTTRDAFLKLAKDWERREGHNYRPRDTQHATLSAQDVAQAIRASQTQLPTDLEHVLDHLEGTGADRRKVQPIKKPDPTAEPPEDTAPMRPLDDFFGPKTTLLLYFKDHAKPLRVTIAGNDEVFIGRATANAAMAPEIDLNAVNAENFGVSRMHAAITRRENKLLITDLESRNYTYVNGMRLLPNEVYILKDGDDIWFAQLQAKVRFQHK